jgi:hypothetical protein
MVSRLPLAAAFCIIAVSAALSAFCVVYALDAQYCRSAVLGFMASIMWTRFLKSLNLILTTK